MKDDLYEWKADTVLEKDGVIVGCTQNQEWLLPWWWMHFRLHNQHPVTFIDFGDMSDAGKKFCRKRGQFIHLGISPKSFVASKEEVSEALSSAWKGQGLDPWQARLAWFLKPFACLQSPYHRAVWIDLDCQVRKSIDPIFASLNSPLKIAVAAEPPVIQEFYEATGVKHFGELEYNTGVVAFEHGSPIIKDWAKMCVKRNGTVRGDQEALSRMLFERNLQIPTLHPDFNCRVEDALDINSVTIFHWLGGDKHHIREEMELLNKYCSIDFSLN